MTARCAPSSDTPDVIALQQILSVVSVLQIDALLADVVTVLENGITVDNCASMLACADHLHLPQLKKKKRSPCRRCIRPSSARIKHAGAASERQSDRELQAGGV